MSNYPVLPDSAPDDPTSAPTPAPQSTYDTIKNRGDAIDAAVDGGPVRGTNNPDNALPASAFHTAPRNFGSSSYGKVRNTPI